VAGTLRRLRGQPGYPRFYATATVTRLADEMFSVGVVLLMLDRTGSAALAGATVAAITLPSLVTGPLLGVWLDLTGRRRSLMVVDQIVISAALVGILLVAGHGPDFLVPLLAFAAGLTYPLSFGGFTSFIPVLVPEELLTPANALETASFNTALVVGPALAGTIAALASPAASLAVEAALSLVALGLLLAIPGLDRRVRGEAAGRTLGEVVRSGLRQLVAVPPLRGVTAAGAIGLCGLGLLTVAFPFFCVEHLGAERSAAGYLWAAFAIGSTIGALGLVRIQRRFEPEAIVLGALAGFGALMLLWPLADSLPAMLALVALAGVADGPGLAATFAVRQQRVPQTLHGQVFTTAAGLKIGAFSLGAALAGPVVVGIGSGGALVAAACMQFAAVAAGFSLMRLPTGAAAARSRP
jgi:MFS family permease